MVIEEELIWIKKIKNGHSQSFGQLYSRYADKLFGLCFRYTGNKSDAEDQLQEVFLKILQKIDSFRAQSSFSTWAYRLATNHLINFSTRRKDTRESDLAEVLEPAGDGRDVPLALALEAAVRQLPEGYRRVFILHDQEGFKHEEIAEILEINAGTSRSQLTRARLALREILKPVLEQETEVAR